MSVRSSIGVLCMVSMHQFFLLTGQDAGPVTENCLRFVDPLSAKFRTGFGGGNECFNLLDCREKGHESPLKSKDGRDT